jgi:uncharacterized protein (DUF58 family)
VSTLNDAELLDAVRGVRWPARRRVPAAAHGVHRSRRRGAAIEFTEYRPYAQGDDPRRIDWKLLARSDRAFVRLSDDHALLPTVFAVDNSASMAFPATTLAKWHHARRITLALAAVAHGAGDPVGLVLAPSALAFAPRTRRTVITELAEALGAAAPHGSMSLERAMSAVVQMAREARIVIVSDFLTDAEDMAATLAAARAIGGGGGGGGGGEVYAIHVVAAEELSPPARDVSVEDPEDPTLRRPLVGSARAAYDREFAAWRTHTAREWRAAGATYVMTTTDEPVDRAVRRIVASP